MTDKRKREARAIMAETGWNYTRALREADRRHGEAEAETQDGSDDGGTQKCPAGPERASGASPIRPVSP